MSILIQQVNTTTLLELLLYKNIVMVYRENFEHQKSPSNFALVSTILNHLVLSAVFASSLLTFKFR